MSSTVVSRMKWYQTLKLLCWELCFNQISWRELARLTVSTLLLTVNFTVKISWQSRPTAKFNSPTFPPPPRYMSDRWLKEQIWLSQYLGANSMLEVLPGACPNCNCQPLKDFVNWKEPLKFNTTTTFNVNDFLTWKFPDLRYFFSPSVCQWEVSADPLCKLLTVFPKGLLLSCMSQSLPQWSIRQSYGLLWSVW